MTRTITYCEALREGLEQAMERDKRVFVMGIGVDGPGAIFGSTTGLVQKFGQGRVFDIPLAENGITGVAVGAALAGMRPVMVHQRMDFMLYAMDQIVNHAAKWHYMFGGRLNVPLTIRAIIGRGWGQGAQHSQSLQALFAHVPGLKVVMPSSAFDAKGLLMASIEDENPVIFIEHRWLYGQTGEVPEEPYSIPIGCGAIKREGRDATVVAISHMVVAALEAARSLEADGIDVEVIDPRSIKPLDEAIICDSIRKTGRLIIADTGWKTGGVGAEIAALAAEKAFAYLKAPVRRVSLPDVPTPTSYALEARYYPGPQDIVSAVKATIRGEAEVVVARAGPQASGSTGKPFEGPF